MDSLIRIKLLRVFIVLVLVAAALGAGLRLRAYRSAVIAFSSPEETEEGYITRPERLKQFEQARRAGTMYGADGRAQVNLARLSRKAGDAAETPEEQITKYCEALSAYGSAVRAHPYGSLELINWANLRQILGNYDCKLPNTDGNFREVANLAIQSDPSNTRVMYAAALISVWSGDKQESQRLFHEVLSYDVNLNEAQRSLILSQLEDSAAIQRIIPARFPQIQKWSAEFSKRYPLRYQQHGKIFEDLQIKAIEASALEFDEGTIPGKIHYQRMLSLIDLAASSTVRQRLDRELASYLERVGKSQTAQMFAERADFKELQIIRATLGADTRPEKGSFSGWGRNENVQFDDFYRSVGFFLADEQSVKLIEIRSRAEAGPVLPNTVRIFVSDDNDQWRDYPGAINVQSVNISGRSMIWIKIVGEQHPYWKIHFANSNRQKSLQNELNLLVHAYGLSTRTE